ncbi:MAG: alpha/beta hydrolase [Rubripirellula sp.]
MVKFSFPWRFACVLLAISFPHGQEATAEQLFSLRNNLVLRGSKAEIATLKDGFGAAAAGEIHVRPIWLIDDGLRRIYIHGRGMVGVPPVDVGDVERNIEFWQPKPLGGKVVAGLGTIRAVSPFNDYGRRVLTSQGVDGRAVSIIQGISELNSRYAKLIALKGKPTLSWDMRLSTRAMDSETLNRIFAKRMDQNDLSSRLEVVRFFIAAERYQEAKDALQGTIDDFPGETDLLPQLTALTKRQAEQLLGEAEDRAAAGQFQLARGILQEFPLDEVSRITKIQVQDALKKVTDPVEQATTLMTQLRGQVAQLAPQRGAALAQILDEMEAGLSPDTIARLSDYTRLGQAANLPLDNRIALAVAGWILGSGSGEQNISVAISLVQVRDLVAEYLRTSDAARRKAILDELSNLEGSEPEYVDRMLPLMVPPLEWPEGSENEQLAGFRGIDTGQSQYLIQLPPEYNPLRQYPCVVALHESRDQPQTQIDWWAGPYSEDAGARMGHASRSGFIVVAPVWSRPGQRMYEYTPQEHQRVLTALRDAMRRASIDADRVFIAGHGEGGTAAWDMALAHPDLWAGMISVSGNPSKTVPHYELNSRHVPLYMVMGELDGNKPSGALLNDYMSFNHDAMIVMYRGRGREYFYDEVPRMFEWMSLASHRRKPQPRDIEVATMRSGDQFFWWLELGELKPGVGIDPILWNQASRIRAGKVTASIGADNQIRIQRGPADQFRVMLRPQAGVLDLNKQVIVGEGNRSKREQFDGSIEFMLEDTRQRADRKRPYWMSVSIP